ncbi:nucleolar complex protein 2 homolog [Callorhinchus milii]|uniref:nucleolar complex protein 2 homolog n=1 Tax=Callorhinchus milii TaxID=7868 RepID=UPI001C3FCE9B|nr:nucleolar complex protein 2 homolog [Callorhinchus milii]
MATPGKRKLAELSVDDFLASKLDSSSSGGDDDDNDGGHSDGEGRELGEEPVGKTKRKRGAVPAKAEEKTRVKPGRVALLHKQQLSRLKEKDPEFFEFLEKNDRKLLNFDETDSSSDEEGNRPHQPPEELELASEEDEDDGDDDEEQTAATKKKKKTDNLIPVTIKMVEKWKEASKSQFSPRIFHEIAMAFKAAAFTTKGEDQTGDLGKYRVEDSAVFNVLVSFCIRDLFAVLQKFLQLKPDPRKKKLVLPSSSRLWPKLRQDLNAYLTALMQLLSSLTEASVVTAVFRHANHLVPYYLCFPKHCRVLLKQTVKHWSTGEETVRVLAFLILNKICRHKKDMYLNPVLKQMYIAYVKNCKFTSPTALPMINFMQRTLTEMYALDHQVTYQHAFIYIRQLAIHLRNAMTMKKRETYQSVYNWQYIHCLYLWCRLLTTLHPNPVLEPLIYPLAQVALGCIKLVSTARYYPLRFHCVRALTLLCDSTKTFIPLLPFLLEVFQQVDFNKKPGRMSMKPINFDVILKLSYANLQEKAFRDGLVEQLYDLILEYCHSQAHTIGFPELVLPSVIQLKAFLKQCKVANYCKQIRQLLEKLQENATHVTKKRQKATFGVSDKESVEAWERQTQEEGTPLSKYYVNWKKLRLKEIALEISGKERMEDLDLPEIKRKRLQESKEKDKKEFRELFESDSDSDDESCGFKAKGQAGKGGKKPSGGAGFLQDLSDMSDEEEDGGQEEDGTDASIQVESDGEEEGGSQKKGPSRLSQSDLRELAEGGEDLVEELELSDED